MFHNVLMTSLAPLRDTNEIQYWDNKRFTAIWPESKQENSKDTSVKKTIKKKKRNRTMFTTDQVRILEKVFKQSKYIDVEKRREISECLQIEQKCIKIWFQNRRMKEKKELSDSFDSSESHVASVKSLSPPLESPQLSKESGVGYIHPYVHSHIRPSEYYHDIPYNYIKAEVSQNEPSNYVSNNTIIPGCLNYNNHFNTNMLGNDFDNTTQYYHPKTEFQYYYNTTEVNNECIMPNIRDYPANIFDTSYF